MCEELTRSLALMHYHQLQLKGDCDKPVGAPSPRLRTDRPMLKTPSTCNGYFSPRQKSSKREKRMLVSGNQFSANAYTHLSGHPVINGEVLSQLIQLSCPVVAMTDACNCWRTDERQASYSSHKASSEHKAMCYTLQQLC